MKRVFFYVCIIILTISCNNEDSTYTLKSKPELYDGLTIKYKTKERELSIAKELKLFGENHMNTNYSQPLSIEKSRTIYPFLPSNDTISEKVTFSQHKKLISKFKKLLALNESHENRMGTGGVSYYVLKEVNDSIEEGAYFRNPEGVIQSIIEDLNYLASKIIPPERVLETVENRVLVDSIFVVKNIEPTYIAFYKEIENCDNLDSLIQDIPIGEEVFLDIVFYPSEDISCIIETFSKKFKYLRWVHSPSGKEYVYE